MTISKNEAGNFLPLKVFTFNPTNQPIRIEMIEKEPYFVANNLCGALGISNSRDAISRLDDDERRVSALPTPSGKQEMNLVNESGLYNLIFQSRKPEAKVSRKWVTGEVLPAIRKTGKYETMPAAQLPVKKRNHNRITKERMVSILADVCRIDNSELRASLTSKLIGGHTV